MSATLLQNSNDPLVSIVIPFFNREEFLAESIESVLAQTYRRWELILIDDGSTDRSAQIARNYREKHPERIFLYAHENGENRGASSSRNLGIKHSKGDLITFLDSDDVFLPPTLETEIAAFHREPAAEVVCGTLQYWFSWSGEADKNERDFIVNLGIVTNELYQPPGLLIHNLRSGGRKPGMGCVILKSGFARRFSLFEDDFKYVCEDQIFWAKISLHAKIYVIDACLAKYRQHAASSIANLKGSGKMAEDCEHFSAWLENYLRENRLENPEIRDALTSFRRENRYRSRFKKLFDLYQKIMPLYVRYRIRDLIVKWRTQK